MGVCVETDQLRTLLQSARISKPFLAERGTVLDRANFVPRTVGELDGVRGQMPVTSMRTRFLVSADVAHRSQMPVNSGNRTLYKAGRGPTSAADGSPLGSHDWTTIVPVANGPSDEAVT